MRAVLSVLSLTTWSLLSLAGITSAAGSGNVTFNGSNRLLFDVDGHHISAYALKIYYKHPVDLSHSSNKPLPRVVTDLTCWILVNPSSPSSHSVEQETEPLAEGKYYGYGLDFTRNEALNAPLLCYSSVDLVNWSVRFLSLGIWPRLTALYGRRKSEGEPLGFAGGRPHVVYNQKTQQYVLWANVDTGYTVATSSAHTGPFTVVGKAALDPQFDGLQPADETVVSFGRHSRRLVAKSDFS